LISLGLFKNTRRPMSEFRQQLFCCHRIPDTTSPQKDKQQSQIQDQHAALTKTP